MKIDESTIHQILKSGLNININVYSNGESTSIAASVYAPDDIIRVVTNKTERMKYRIFIQNVENVMIKEFNYEFECNKYSVQYPNSVSKYYVIRKQHDTTKPIRFPISIKITDHNLTDSGENEQEEYIIKKVNKLGGYKSKPHQKQKPESAIRKINILDLECDTYPEAEVAFRSILSDIELSINLSRIKEYKDFVPETFRTCSSYQIEWQGAIVETFSTIDQYILWLLEQNLVCRDSYNMNLDLLRFDTKYKDSVVYGEAKHNNYVGIAII